MLKTEHREQLAAITGPEADAKRAALKAKQAIALEVAQERLDKWRGCSAAWPRSTTASPT